VGGEPVGQTQVGQDDPLPQDRVTADRVLEQPVGLGGLGHSVTEPDVDNVVMGRGRQRSQGLLQAVLHGVWADETGSNRARTASLNDSTATPQVPWLNPGNGDLEAGGHRGVDDEDEADAMATEKPK